MTALSEFHFLRPLWLLGLLLVPLLLLAWRRYAGRVSPWRRAVDPHLLAALLDAAPVIRTAGPGWLIACLPVLAFLALAGPAWERLPQPLLRSESALVIALDLSARMRAADLAPDRLQRARFKIADVLRERGDGQIALLAYAGDAFTVAPLTNDAATLESLLAALEPELMPAPGQRADRAIERAVQLIADAGFSSADVLLVTDQADASAIQAATAAAQHGVRVSALGIGTTTGAPIPLPGGSFVTDRDGKPQMAALDTAALSKLALAGQGRYATISADAADLRQLGLLDATGSAVLADDELHSVPRFRDQGPWLLLLMLPLAALCFRRGWLGCLPLLMVISPTPAQALSWADLWTRPDQRAHEALQRGDYEAATTLSSDPLLQGSAAYKSGDFKAAQQAFAAAEGADADYNRGNALARAGQLKPALQAYDEALAKQPDMADALANRAAVERALQQQQQQKDQQDQQQGDQPPPEDGEQSPSEQPSDDQSKDQENASESSDGSDPADQDAESDGKKGEQQDPASSKDKDDDSAGQRDAEEAKPESAQEAEARERQQQELGQQIDEAMDQQTDASAPPEPVDQVELEAQQVTEQLLRRIPDDPGGLLRRKFALEHRQRVIEGKGEDR